jgi:hypothetical protein
MSPFRSSDDALEGEIATLETIVRIRVRRAAADLRELECDLRELRRERARRRGVGEVPERVASAEPIDDPVL